MNKKTKITIGSITAIITTAGTAIGVVVKELKDDENVIDNLRKEIKQDTDRLNALTHDIKDTFTTHLTNIYKKVGELEAAVNIALRHNRYDPTV